MPGSSHSKFLAVLNPAAWAILTAQLLKSSMSATMSVEAVDEMSPPCVAISGALNLAAIAAAADNVSPWHIRPPTLLTMLAPH